MATGQVITIIGAVLIAISIAGSILMLLHFGRIYFFDSALIAAVVVFMAGLSDVQI